MKEQKKSESIASTSESSEQKTAATPKESKEKKSPRAPKKVKEPVVAVEKNDAELKKPNDFSVQHVALTPVKNSEKAAAQEQKNFSGDELAHEQSKPVHSDSSREHSKPAPRAPQDNQHAPQQNNRPQQSHHQKNDGYRQHGKSRTAPTSGGQQQQAPVDRRPLEEMTLAELNIFARRYGIVGAGLMTKPVLSDRIKYAQAHPDDEMEVTGVLEKLPDGFGFLRSALYDYVSGPDDVYISPSQIRRFGLRTGDTVVGVIRKPKEGEKYFALLKIDKVNDSDPMTMADRPNFERLTPQHPHEKFNLEFNPDAISTRIMDLFTPIGKGQ